MLPLGLTDEALSAAAAETEPESLPALVRLRKRFGPTLAAAAVTQVVLRRRAVTKFGSVAGQLFFTREGLEQASRPAVAAHHAQRMLASGVRRVVDLGCGIGTDALAFARAGLEVVAVDSDPATAEVTAANLRCLGHATSAEVLTGPAEELWPGLANRSTGVFCDPARRTARGRSWRMEDLSPSWSFVTGLLDGAQPTGVKLGPGLPYDVIPAGAEAEWLSSAGDTVEVGLWAGRGSMPGEWSALIVDDPARRLRSTVNERPAVALPRAYLYEPLGAVIRSRGIATLAVELDAALLDSDLAYLTADVAVSTPFATRFAVVEAFPYRGNNLRAWTTERNIGVLEIKTRGLALDPAALRPRLRLRGTESATVVITRAIGGPTVVVVRRETIS